MFVFIAIAAAGFILLLGGSVFGHDHDHDAHVDHEHDGEGADEPTVSIFSIKVLATFVMGFGAGGAIDFFGLYLRLSGRAGEIESAR
jgi:hypothetical protein